VLALATLAALPSIRAIETHSLPILVRCYPCSFTFYVSDPVSSILSIATCSMSLLPFAPLYLGCSRSAWPLPRGFTGHVAPFTSRNLDSLVTKLIGPPAIQLCCRAKTTTPISFARRGG
jgi:hypothetical protein